jgi:hypothetical protein
MAILVIIISILILALIPPKRKKKRGAFGVILALLFFPIGIILSLAGKYK